MPFALIGLWSEGEGLLFGLACCVFVNMENMHQKLVADSARSRLCVTRNSRQTESRTSQAVQGEARGEITHLQNAHVIGWILGVFLNGMCVRCSISTTKSALEQARWQTRMSTRQPCITNTAVKGSWMHAHR